eukprot:1146110-Pelagomonas_calceolata.AAC.10
MPLPRGSSRCELVHNGGVTHHLLPGSPPFPLLLTCTSAGKKVFIAGVADDQGFGWGIAKALAEAGAEISLGVWVPALNIFESSYRKGKFDESRKLSNGSLMEFKHVFPMDAVFDTLEDVPEEVSVRIWLFWVEGGVWGAGCVSGEQAS